MDEPRDLRYLKNSFKKLRKSRQGSPKGIESFGSVLRRPDEPLGRGRSPPAVLLGRSLDEYARSSQGPVSTTKSKARQAFVSPAKAKEQAGQVDLFERVRQVCTDAKVTK